MKKCLCFVAGLFLALAGSPAARAQTPAAPPPNILNIETVNLKPYQSGPYDKVASQYAGLSQQFKDPARFLAMESLTGSPRAIYLTGYNSYEALQKNEEWLLGDTATDAKFDALDARAAACISEVQYSIWHYRPDLSNNVAGADLPHAHYWQVIIFHMRSGQDGQFEELAKLQRDANLKIGQNFPWATYEGLTGGTNTYLVLIPMKSLKDADTGLARKQDFGAALGNEGRDRMNKLSEKSVASVENNLWMVNPEWSYVEKSWIDADPHYWGLEPGAKTAPKPKVPPAH